MLTRRPRPLVAAAALALAAGLVGPVPAGGQQPPAESTVTITTAIPPSINQYRRCDGEVIPLINPGGILATRTEPFADALSVPVEVTGALESVPAAIEFEAGDDTAVLTLTPAEPEPGDFTIALVDGDGYALGEPSTADLPMGPPTDDLYPDCLQPLTPAEGRGRQVIDVGERPEPLGLGSFGVVPGADGRDLPTNGYTEVQGDLPPGLTYAADVWGGAATTPGTYRFGVSVCVPAGYFGPVDACMGTAAIEIVVLGDGIAAPGPAAPPAGAVEAEARFTG